MLNKMKKTKAGFTLVELIVVIAILAILAGVAIPVYSGYIKKANQAADNMLLAAVNTAFGAASVEGAAGAPGMLNNHGRPKQASATIGDEGIVVKSSVDTTGGLFSKYFEGNDGSFKTYKTLIYDSKNGVFTGSTIQVSTSLDEEGNATVTVTTEDGETITYTATKAQIDAYNASTFGQNMSPDALLGEVGSLVNSVSTALGGGSMIVGLIGEDTLTNWGITKDAEGNYNNADLANALVLYVAKESDTTLLSDLNTAIASGNVNSFLSGGKLPVKMAMAYGMMMAFANSDKADAITVNGMSAEAYMATVNENIAAAAASDKGQSEKLNDIMTAFGGISALMEATDADGNNVFQAYATQDAATDGNGYINTMQVITANLDSLRQQGVIANGFDDGAIAAILSQVLAG